MKEPVQLLEDEGIQNEESPYLSYFYHKTLEQYFDRTHLVVERSSKDSTSNEESYCSKNEKYDEKVHSILKLRIR